MVYLYLPSCRAPSFSASLCCFLQGIWRSLTLPSKSIVFAIYSPPVLLYLLSTSPSPASLLLIFPQFSSASLLLPLILSSPNLISSYFLSCLIQFELLSCSSSFFLSYLITSLPTLHVFFPILFPSCFFCHFAISSSLLICNFPFYSPFNAFFYHCLLPYLI